MKLTGSDEDFATDAGIGPESRTTGISPLASTPWGTHLCVFYETTQDLLDTVADYFVAGVQGNEACVWVVSEPITVDDAARALREVIPDFDRRSAVGQVEILPGYEWYLGDNEFDVQRITGGWTLKLDAAVAAGYSGLRISGNAFWFETSLWQSFYEYEQEVGQLVADQRMLALCTYSLLASKGVHLMDVARTHQACIARRQGAWEFLETPEMKLAKLEIGRLNSAVGLLTNPFPGRNLLTPRERTVLAHIAMAKSNKELALALDVSPRTAEFHRANILRKLGARNTVELMRIVLGGK